MKVDKFKNKKNVESHCYRVYYRSLERFDFFFLEAFNMILISFFLLRTLTNDEINVLQAQLREQASSHLGVSLR